MHSLPVCRMHAEGFDTSLEAPPEIERVGVSVPHLFGDEAVAAERSPKIDQVVAHRADAVDLLDRIKRVNGARIPCD